MNRREFLISCFFLPFLRWGHRFDGTSFPHIGVRIPNLRPFLREEAPFSLSTLVDFLSKHRIRNLSFPFHWDLFFPRGIGILNQEAVKFYDAFIALLRQHQITPWACCYSDELPQFFLQEKVNWTQETLILAFRHYIETLVHHYGNQVPIWMVSEKLFLQALKGYLIGEAFPFLKGERHFTSALKNMLLSLTSAFRILKHANPNLQVGFAEAYFPILLTPYQSQLFYEMDLFFNRLVLEIISGYSLPTSLFPSLKAFQRDSPYVYLIRPDFYGIHFSHALELDSNQVERVGKFPVPSKRTRWLQTIPKDYHLNAFFSQVKSFSLYPAVQRLIVTGHSVTFPREGQLTHDEPRKHLLHLFFQLYQSEGISFFAYFYDPLYDPPELSSTRFQSGIAYWNGTSLQWKESGKLLVDLFGEDN